MTDQGRGSPDVTVVIAAHDEARNIEACIATVKWAREVIIVENDSTDDTVARARAAGATVISPKFTTIGKARNHAIERAQGDWVLVVDADERCTPELATEIRAKLAASPAEPAFRIPRKNFFLGEEVKHGGWENDRPIRLFRRNLRYNASAVHEHVDVIGVTGTLENALLHYPYDSLNQYFEKFNRYSRCWAEQNYAKGRRTGAAAVFFRPPARFLSMYVLKGGFMDGARGVVLASLAAASVMAKYARLWEKSVRNKPEPVLPT